MPDLADLILDPLDLLVADYSDTAVTFATQSPVIDRSHTCIV